MTLLDVESSFKLPAQDLSVLNITLHFRTFEHKALIFFRELVDFGYVKVREWDYLYAQKLAVKTAHSFLGLRPLLLLCERAFYYI